MGTRCPFTYWPLCHGFYVSIFPWFEIPIHYFCVKGIVSDFGKSSSHPGYKMCTCTHSKVGWSATGQQHIHQSTLTLDPDWTKAPLILIGQRFQKTKESENQKEGFMGSLTNTGEGGTFLYDLHSAHLSILRKYMFLGGIWQEWNHLLYL